MVLFVARLRRLFNTTGMQIWHLDFVTFEENAWREFCWGRVNCGSVSALLCATKPTVTSSNRKPVCLQI